MKTRKKHKKRIAISLILLISIGSFFYFNKVVNPIIISYSEAKVRSLSTKAVNFAVHEVIESDEVYSNLIKITTDKNGKINLIQANPIEMNQISKELIKVSQNKIEALGGSGIDIPLGAFSGVPALTGLGPKVSLKLMPIGSIKCSFKSEFVEAGINQTNHRIYVNVETAVKLIIPTKNSKVQTSTQILLCESIIIGEVPNTYLNSNNVQDMLDLIP